MNFFGNKKAGRVMQSASFLWYMKFYLSVVSLVGDLTLILIYYVLSVI